MNPRDGLSKALAQTVVWFFQLVLAFVYAVAGFLNTTKSPEQLAAMGMASGDVPIIITRFVGTVELLGAAAIVLPGALALYPRITPYAGVGLILIQIFAIIVHGWRGELAQTLPFNLLMIAMSYTVTYAHFSQPKQIAPLKSIRGAQRRNASGLCGRRSS